MGGACCYYGVCCPPGSAAQARSLADATGIDLEAAVKVAGSFRLLPKDLPKDVNEAIDSAVIAYLEKKGLPTR